MEVKRQGQGDIQPLPNLCEEPADATASGGRDFAAELVNFWQHELKGNHCVHYNYVISKHLTAAE